MPDFARIARDRVLTLGLGARREADLIEELAGQMEEIHGAALAEGVDEGEALRRAMASLPVAGGFGRRRWFADLGFAWRLYARQPWFLVAAVVAIGVGIGATVTIFSLLDAVVLRPLDYRRPQELVMVWERHRGGPDNVVAAANYLEWRGRTAAFLGSSPVISMTRNLVGVGEPVEVGIEAVAWDYLRLLGGVELELGRDFVAEDDAPETPAAVLLSHRLWRERFGGDRGVVGRRLRLDGLEAVVVGVLPAGFRSLGEDPEMLTTARLDAAVDYRVRGRFLRVVARVADLGFAQRELDRVARVLEQERPEFNGGWGVRVVPLAEHFSARARGALWLLMAAVGVVLLVVCGNVANLLLGRLGARERELAVRFALGARPGQLAWQLMQESLLLAGLGGLLGCGLAGAGAAWLRGLAEVPRLASAGFDGRVALFALVVTVGAALLFGWAPAWAAGRWSLARVPRRSVWGDGFLVAQVALALVLLLGAVSLVGKFRAVMAADLGFAAGRVVTMTVSLPGPRDTQGFFAALEERLRRLPEVERVGAVAWLPLAGPAPATEVRAGGRRVAADVQAATAGYFEAMGVPVLAGKVWGGASEVAAGAGGVGVGAVRMGTIGTGATGPVVGDRERALAAEAGTLVVSAGLARALFPGGDALGRVIEVNMRGFEQPRRIVGVVGDVRHESLEAAARPTVYYSHGDLAWPAMTMVMRARPEAGRNGLASAAVAMVRELDPAQPVRAVRTMEEWVNRSVAERRLVAAGCGAFAVVAVGLALLGVYGAFSRWVEGRRKELGVRLALGAGAGEVVRMLARHGVALLGTGFLGAGLALGLLLWLWPARVWALWPSGTILVVTIFAFVLLAAGSVVVPARRAIQTDPLVVLRQE